MSKSAASSSFPLFSILGLVFIVLKLAGIGAVAQWSWWWVLAPFWGGAAIVIVVMLVFFFAIAIREARRQARR